MTDIIGTIVLIVLVWFICDTFLKNEHKNKYQVESIDIKETYEWLKNKHYAKRIPQILSAFGLYNKIYI